MSLQKHTACRFAEALKTAREAHASKARQMPEHQLVYFAIAAEFTCMGIEHHAICEDCQAEDVARTGVAA